MDGIIRITRFGLALLSVSWGRICEYDCVGPLPAPAITWRDQPPMQGHSTLSYQIIPGSYAGHWLEVNGGWGHIPLWMLWIYDGGPEYVGAYTHEFWGDGRRLLLNVRPGARFSVLWTEANPGAPHFAEVAFDCRDNNGDGVVNINDLLAFQYAPYGYLTGGDAATVADWAALLAAFANGCN